MQNGHSVMTVLHFYKNNFYEKDSINFRFSNFIFGHF